jgi:hypothetical protein
MRPPPVNGVPAAAPSAVATTVSVGAVNDLVATEQVVLWTLVGGGVLLALTLVGLVIYMAVKRRALSMAEHLEQVEPRSRAAPSNDAPMTLTQDDLLKSKVESKIEPEWFK